MLRKQSAFAVCAALFALLAGCGDDGGNPSFSMSATVDGSKFNSSVVTASTDGPTMNISAGSNTEIITLHVNMPATPGTVTLSPFNTVNFARLDRGNSRWGTEAGGSGSVVFTTVNQNVAVGTFSFTAISDLSTAATGTRNVTNGSFKVQF